MSLEGINVLVTRPAGQAEVLADAICRAGGKAVLCPLMSIEPVAEPESVKQIADRIARLDQYQLAIFVSSNAARLALPWINQFWPVLPPGLVFLAIGPATAAELDSLQCEIQTANGGVSSEDLLRLPLLLEVAGRKIVIFRGVGGRELLADTLRQRGAIVDYIELYHRMAPLLPPQTIQNLILEEDINVIVVTSGQILEELQRQLGSIADSNNSFWGLIPLLVPSARVAQQAIAAGFTRVINVNSAEDTAIVASLASLASHRQQRP
ncbi:MAG: uroporphyrinogen-III synthase [Pseudohongiellaceae bacterium]